MSIDVSGFGVSFNGRVAIKDIEMKVEPGEILGLAGMSGSGKTTLLRAIAGLLPRRCRVWGTIEADGVRLNPVDSPAQRACRSIAYMAQNPFLACSPMMTVREIICEPALLASRGCSDFDEVCRRCDVTPDILDRLPDEVSGGQLQRATLARTLMARPRYILADEPTAALDPMTTARIARVLRQAAKDGCGVVVAGHDRALLEAL